MFLGTLHEDSMHPCRLQKMQAMIPEDYLSQLQFSRWYLQQTAANQTFLANVLFTDEAILTLSGMFNIHNSPLWSHGNPHSTIAHPS